MPGGPIVRLPFWFWLGYADVTLWYVTIPAATILVLLGWHAAEWLGTLRWVAFAAAALLLVPFPVAAALFVYGKISAAADAAALQRTLAHDETVAGLPLIAGSRVRFRDRDHSGVASIDLPRATDIRGMRLVGTMTWNASTGAWSGTLAEDRRLDGWPCRAGAIEFGTDGVVQRCELAAAHTLLGLALPRGTHVTRGSDTTPWALRLPADAGVAVPALSTTAPAGVTLSVASDGRLEKIDSGHGQTIVVRGIALSSRPLYVQGEQVVAPLAQPFVIGGALTPPGARVQIDLATGAVALADPTWRPPE
jgi:hypothetical protein